MLLLLILLAANIQNRLKIPPHDSELMGYQSFKVWKNWWGNRWLLGHIGWATTLPYLYTTSRIHTYIGPACRIYNKIILSCGTGAFTKVLVWCQCFTHITRLFVHPSLHIVMVQNSLACFFANPSPSWTEEPIEPLFFLRSTTSISPFATWHKLIKVTAYLSQFVRRPPNIYGEQIKKFGYRSEAWAFQQVLAKVSESNASNGRD